MTEEVKKNSGLSRRTVMKGAAWSVPVVAAAVATPLAAASGAIDASLAWTGSSTGLLSLNVLDGGGTLTASALVTVPTEFSTVTGPGPITGPTAVVELPVGRPQGNNIPVGRARGFGVYSIDGVPTSPGQRTATYQTAPIVGQFGFPLTSFTGTQSVTVAANGTLSVPVVFGLAGVSTGVAVSALASFPVTLTLTFPDSTSYTAISTITVPVGAGIL